MAQPGRSTGRCGRFVRLLLRLLVLLHLFFLVRLVGVPFMPETEPAAGLRSFPLRLFFLFVLFRIQCGGVVLLALLVLLGLRVLFAPHKTGKKAGMLFLLRSGITATLSLKNFWKSLSI